MGVMTERKLLGIVADLFPKGMDPDYRSGFIAGFYQISPGPCPTKNGPCAQGVVAGNLVREFYFGLKGESDDEIVKISIAGLLGLDSEAMSGPRFTSYGLHRNGLLLNEVLREKPSSSEPSQFPSFGNMLRLAEETDSGGSV